MAELRWNPIAKDWIMVAGHRQARPTMPKDWCPFCPGSGKVPEKFDVLRYQNDFPALSVPPHNPDDVAVPPLFEVSPNYGRCEVILYSPDHHGQLRDLGDEHVHKLAALWQETFIDLSSDPNIKYVFIFENKGEVVGVTMPHPHGQVYGYPFMPKKIEQELQSAVEHHNNNGKCLFCELLKAEKDDGRRIVFQNEYFTAYIPFFSPLTYGIHVTANSHIPHIGVMNKPQLDALGETVRSVSGMYDSLFDTSFPYMMCMHNAPVNTDDDALTNDAFHFHIEFIPPMRSGTVQQFFASSETGVGVWCNPSCPEEKAGEMRKAYEKYCKNGG